MADQAALIAVLIIDRALCLDCIASRSGMSVVSVKGYLERMGTMITLQRTTNERCRACGIIGNVVSLVRLE